MNTREARARIEELADYNVFISLTDEECDGPVVAVKDLVDVRGTFTTGGSVILPNEPAAEDAPVVRRLRAAGCCVVGKTNLHEWALGVTNENPHHGAVRNPRDPARMAGGSSGGSAAAVAAGMCDWAIGSDTGGSVRIPASLCGVVGIRPTFGMVDTTGVIPLAWSLDTVGPLAPDVRSAARALEIMSGVTGLVPEGRPDLAALRLAVPAGWVDELDAETQEVWERISDGLPEIPFPALVDLKNLYLPVFLTEASAYHRDWIERYPDQYGSDVLTMLRRGLQVPGVEYVRALRQREPARAAVEAAMIGWDAVLLPTTACVAPPLGTPNVREKLLHFNRPFSFTGQPSMSVPGPTTGLPVGIQVIGRFGRDAELCHVGRALELAWA
jgi:aspartyl-tRNA(Asn)/glutamyl-tRNA(Gln) amidotransferase subunit A